MSQENQIKALATLKAAPVSTTIDEVANAKYKDFKVINVGVITNAAKNSYQYITATDGVKTITVPISCKPGMEATFLITAQGEHAIRMTLNPQFGLEPKASKYSFRVVHPQTSVEELDAIFDL
jgi:hypothetical protein